MRSPAEVELQNVRARYFAFALGGDVDMHACALFQNALQGGGGA